MKMEQSVLDEKSPFKILGLTFSCKLDGGFKLGLTLPILLKLPPRKFEP